MSEYRDPKYLKFLRGLPCMICCSREGITAAHIGTSNFKIKPPDNQAVPLCGKCHWLQEYHKNKFQELTGKKLPNLEDCEYYFTLFSQKPPSHR